MAKLQILIWDLPDGTVAFKAVGDVPDVSVAKPTDAQLLAFETMRFLKSSMKPVKESAPSPIIMFDEKTKH